MTTPPARQTGRRRPILRPASRGTAAVASFLLGLLAVQPVLADQISDKQHQRDQVSGFISNLQGQISQTQDREAALNAVIQQLSAQVAQTQQSIAAAQAELQRIAEQLAAEQEHLREEQARLDRDKRELGADMKLVYEANNDSTPLNNLLTSGNFNEFWQRLLQLRRIADSEHSTVDRVHAERDDVQSSVNRIAGDERRQQSTVSQLNSTMDALAVQLASRQGAQQVLAGVEADDRQRLAENQRAAAQLDSEIASLREAQRQAEEAARRRAAAEAAGRAAAARRQGAQAGLGDATAGLLGGGGSGQFQWPERGPISQGFGCTAYTFEQYDPNCPQRHFHSGIDIAAPGGTPVAAADAGTAYTYASSYGFGNHVIIIHGGGFATVYGHLSGFNVGNGDSIGRGRVIGYEGSTGNSTGPHLHFEIRLNETPVNPFNYLP